MKVIKDNSIYECDSLTVKILTDVDNCTNIKISCFKNTNNGYEEMFDVMFYVSNFTLNFLNWRSCKEMIHYFESQFLTYVNIGHIFSLDSENVAFILNKTIVDFLRKKTTNIEKDYKIK